MAKQSLPPFMQMDKKQDMNPMNMIEKKAGKPAAKKFQAEDKKEDKKLFGKKSGKPESQIMKMDEKKDKKLMPFAIKTAKK
jgi:hypothetical protein